MLDGCAELCAWHNELKCGGKDCNFGSAMHCLPQRLIKSMFLEKIRVEKSQRDQASENFFLQKMLILIYEVIIQSEIPREMAFSLFPNYENF